MTDTPNIPMIRWRSYGHSSQWSVSVAIEGTDLGATWKGPAANEEAARGNALRDIPRLLRVIAHLAEKPFDPRSKFTIEMSSARLGETDDFRLGMLSAGSANLLEAASSRCTIPTAEVNGIAHALFETLLAIGTFESDGIIHLNYGRLSEGDTGEMPSVIFDTDIIPYGDRGVLMLDCWPEAFSAALIATSVLHVASGGRHDDGQVRRDIPDSATIRSVERYQARQKAPLNAPAIGALLRECGLPDDARAFEKTFGLGYAEEETA